MSRSLYARLQRRFKPRSGISRRAFLKASLAAGAGLLLSNCRTFSPAAGSGKRVLVIGAGFAGLACAHELLSAGYDVTVLEARGRAGGRVLSLRDWLPGKNIEGGGEYIGSNHPAWAGFAEQFGLEFLDFTEDESLADPVLLDGRLLDARQAQALFEEMEHAYANMTEAARAIDADQPWRSANALQLDRQTTADWISELDVSTATKRAIAAELAGDNGAATARQSFLGNLAQVKGGGLENYWTESEVYRCRGGNDLLAKKLAEGMGARLHLRTPVATIRAGETSVEAVGKNGASFRADELVLALPPSVWPDIQFEPALPAALAPQMGVSLKYIAAVKNRFWRESGISAAAATDGMISMTWEATENQPGDSPVALTAFSGGPPAELCRQKFRESRDKTYREELERIFPKFGEHYLNGRFMDWPGDPWTLAGYSFPAPGQVTTVGPMLHEGLGRLRFAGEHACYKFVGYMEGALNSGVSVARRLAAADGVLQN